MDRVVKQHRGSAKPIIVVNQLYEEIPVPVTTSVKVAEKFDRQHKHVMDSINTIIATMDSIGEAVPNFRPSNYLNRQNKSQPMFIMDRDASSILVFGFTGEKALGYHIDFVKAFNASQGFSKIS